MQGNPGEGKTTFALRLAAACTTGGTLPGMKSLPPFNGLCINLAHADNLNGFFLWRFFQSIDSFAEVFPCLLYTSEVNGLDVRTVRKETQQGFFSHAAQCNVALVLPFLFEQAEER